MQQEPKKRTYPSFHPTLEGCVAHDRSLCRALEERYADELYTAASNTYRSLLCENRDRPLSDLFNEIAREEIVHFRLVGELISALGGDPTLHAQIRVDPLRFSRDDPHLTALLCTDAIREEKRLIDRYETLMSKTEDRVVRSVFSQLISDEQYHVNRLTHAAAL